MDRFNEYLILLWQVSRWKAGSYTLLSDEDADACEYALDVWFFLSADHWQLDHGGQIAYIARNEDEEVLLFDIHWIIIYTYIDVSYILIIHTLIYVYTIYIYTSQFG